MKCNALPTISPDTIELGLERVAHVAQKGQLLSFDCPVITIGGTNGKGSTVTTLALLMAAANKRYATYTSPHLLRFNERIRLHGKMVEDPLLEKAFNVITDLAEDTRLTYFEWTTLVALWIFKQTPLDLIILEVGMGGALDAVNVVSPDIAVLTSISYDHQDYLGHTLAEIAQQKAGILRSRIPVILSHEACHDVMLERTQKEQNTVFIEEEHFGNLKPDQWICKLSNKTIPLPSHYLPINSVSLAMATYTVLEKCLGMLLPPLEKSVMCLEGAGMLGRCHRFLIDNKTLILDVAHNPAGTAWLARTVGEKKPSGKCRAVWSSVADKLCPALIAPLKEIVDVWYVGKIEETERASSVESLVALLQAQGIASIYPEKTVEAALQRALREAEKGDTILIWGSHFTVAKGYEVMGRDSMIEADNGAFYTKEPI